MINNQFYKRHAKAALAAVSSLAIMATNCAAAQGQDDKVDEEPLEEITIFGRFQQSLTDRLPILPEELPFTLNSLGRDTLDELNYARPIDAIANLPNISIFSDLFNTGTPLMLSRGYFAPLLVDNRSENAFRGSAAQDDSFVDRYEVLKGPASVSVGAVESGGIFNTVTKSPEMDPFIGVELRTDQFGTIAGEFDLNTGPVANSDKVRFRLSGAYRNWQYDAKETKRETIAIRPVLEADLAETTSVKISASYIQHNVNPNKGFPIFVYGAVPDHIGTDTFTSYQNGEGTSKSKYVAVELIHDFLDNLTLKMRGSHARTDFDYVNTSGFYNYGGVPVIGELLPRRGINPAIPYVNTYSYAGDIEEKNTYLDAQLATYFEFNGQQQDFAIGTTYNKNSFLRLFTFAPGGFVYGLPVSAIGEPKYGIDKAIFDAADPTVQNDDSGKLKSIYAEAALRPTEDITIVGGIRYDDVEQHTDSDRSIPNIVKASATTFRLGTTYQILDGLGVYGSYAQSFGPQTGNLRGNGGQPGPQRTGGWEFGLKGKLFEDTLTFNAAFFTTTRSNVSVRDPNNVFPEDFVVTIGSQRARGVEITADWAPIEGLNINLNYGYIDIDILASEGDITEYSIPKNTFTAFVTYKFLDGALDGLTLGGGPRYVGKKPSQYAGLDFPAITLVDAFVSYPVTEKIVVTLNAHNLLDKFYRESTGTYFGRLTGSHVFGAPRTISLTVRGRF